MKRDNGLMTQLIVILPEMEYVCIVPVSVAVLASVVLVWAVLCWAVDTIVVSAEVPLVDVAASIE